MFSPLNIFAQSLVVEDQTVERNIKQIEKYYLLDSEVWSNKDVINLCSEVIQKRQFYSSNLIAKAYALLAEIAKNKGDMARSFQFASDGLSQATIDTSIRINLLLKVAAGYYTKGKYRSVLAIVEQAIELSNEEHYVKFRLIALSYRAMAYALVAEHDNAIRDLQVVDQLTSEYKQFADHLVLLDILAKAHYYLGDYDTAIALYHKLLKLQMTLSRTQAIAGTYYHLATSYLRLNQLDDAYHSFWESKQYAEESQAPIRIAYAQLGLGQVMLMQQEYDQSYQSLSDAKRLFQGQNLMQPYLSTLIALSKASLNTDRQALAFQLLEQAELLAETIDLTIEQIELYQLLSQMYEHQKDYQKSVVLLSQYVELQRQFSVNPEVENSLGTNKQTTNTQSTKLAVKLAESAELRVNFSDKFKRQQHIIFVLSFVVVLLSVALIWIWLAKRSRKMNQAYDLIERPVYLIANTAQTKQFYQLEYKKARKYEYPLAVGYLFIDNWKELNFRFNNKTVNEVTKTISTLINECIGEFEHAGLLNDGEYLILSPHCSIEHIEKILSDISNALAVRFFANLGDFSIKVLYSCDSPVAQDIDPYIFLSRLSSKKKLRSL